MNVIPPVMVFSEEERAKQSLREPSNGHVTYGTIESLQEPETVPVSECSQLDSGWRAWMVLYASFMMIFLSEGLMYTCPGILLPEMVKYFGMSQENVIPVFSLMAFLQSCTPMAALLIKTIGHRIASIIAQTIICINFCFLVPLIIINE